MLVGKTRRGRWATVGGCCRRRLVGVHGFGITVTGGPPSVYADMAERAGLGGVPIYGTPADGPKLPWRASDRAWFAAHPDRSHRARYPLPGELAAHGLAPADHTGAVILVRQVAPGERIRVPMRGPLPPDDEAFIAELLDALARGDGRGLSRDEIRARVALRGMGGRA